MFKKTILSLCLLQSFIFLASEFSTESATESSIKSNEFCESNELSEMEELSQYIDKKIQELKVIPIPRIQKNHMPLEYQQTVTTKFNAWQEHLKNLMTIKKSLPPDYESLPEDKKVLFHRQLNRSIERADGAHADLNCYIKTLSGPIITTTTRKQE